MVHNPDRPQIQDLDALPHVTDVYKRDLDITALQRAVPAVSVCLAVHHARLPGAVHVLPLAADASAAIRGASAPSDDVAREMAKAKEYWPGVKEFFFDDDTFNIQKARTIELCEKLKPLGLTWSCTSRVTTDYETLKAMKEAGCRLLIVGYESGDQQILKNIKKGATVERARQFTKDCHKLGLVIHGDFIIGLPGETRETIHNTIDFAKELDVETIQVSMAHAYPGHRALRLRREERLHGGGHQDGGRRRPSAGPDSVSRACRRTKSWTRCIASTTNTISGPRRSTAFSARRYSTASSASGCTRKPRAS